MNEYVVYFFLGVIVGYYIVMYAMNTIDYHAMDSKKVRNTYFIYDDKKIRFAPKVIGKIEPATK
jgi:hypothetical protein